MKRKRITAFIFAALLLVGACSALAASAGSSADPLISLSYIQDTYVHKINEQAMSKIDAALEPIYSEITAPGGSTNSFVLKNIAAGGTVTLNSGGSVILLSGSGTVNIESGTVICITDGSTVRSGDSLVRYYRYLAAEDTTATVNVLTPAYAAIDGVVRVMGDVESPFKDVFVSDWYFDAVKYAVDKQLFTGTSETTFSPGTNMTRAMLVTVLHRMEGKPAVTAVNNFKDVKNGQWYTNAILWANANNIVTGYGSGLFGTDDPITREQMAAILYRYASAKGYNVSDSDDLARFTDAPSVSEWALDAMKWAVAKGLVNGTTETTLSPGGTATRAQVATILMRFAEGLAR
ncbi:MAG: S-layer homology domain-containing protein [Oscillospiraceae bacterium]